ncbi:PKD domain-containing protein, partial [Candidatus Bathyarchaeota archaeon]|nr:PKD domain-containing protein [Candidatus Bathyarchaeota archaeon]
GIYWVFANATVVERDVNATNNQMVDGTIEVTSHVTRDVTVVGITANSTLFAQGETALITMTVENKGSIDEKNLNLTIYFNNTLLEEVLFPDIFSGDDLEYSFDWSTEDSLGDCVFRANVTVLTNETDVTNNEMTMTIIVTKVPVADFTFSPAEPLRNVEITFDASASYDPDGNIVNYTWNFGESYIISGNNVSTYIGHGKIVKYAYTHAGTFKVTLTVTDNKGLTYTASRVLTYPSRTEKNITIVEESSTTIPPVALNAITAVIVVVVLVTVYMKLLRKPKIKSQSK